MKLRVLTLVILTLATLSLAQAAPLENPLCVLDGYGCFEGYDQTGCVAISGTYYQTGDEAPTSCQLGCCFYTDYAKENTPQAACPAGNQWAQGNCPETVTPLCQYDGQTDCRCVNVDITEQDGLYCCSGTATDDPTCSGDAPENPENSNPFENTCNNGKLESYESCDRSVNNGNQCPQDHGANACTNRCRCQLDPELYNPTDDVCEPGEACANDGVCQTNPPEPEQLTGRAITATPNGMVQWQHPQQCDAQRTHYLVLIVGNEGKENEFQTQVQLGASATEHTFEMVPRVKYRVYVRAYVQSGAYGQADVSIDSVDAECLTSVRSYCQDAQNVVECDDENQLRSSGGSSSCSGDELCFQTSQGAACLEAGVCDTCNGAFGNFGEVNSNTRVTLPNEDAYSCQILASRPISVSEDGSAQMCHVAYTKSALKAYQSCGQVNRCADYNSQSTCESASGGSCNLPMNCQWKQSGICTSQEEAFQVCEDAQNAQQCTDIGNRCRFVANKCLDKEEITCNDYENDIVACLGAGTNRQGFSLNSVDNTFTPSNDAAGKGKCVWQGDWCWKDADGNGAPESNPKTAHDFTNPITTIGSDLTATYGVPMKLSYGVNEPVLGTYASLEAGDCSVKKRPSTKLTRGEDGLAELMPQNAQSISGATPHCLRIWSKDVANNSEIVQQLPVTINPDILRVQEVSYALEIHPDGTTTNIEYNVTLSRSARCEGTVESNGRKLRQDILWNAQRYRSVFVDVPTTEDYVTAYFSCTYEDYPPVDNTTLIPLAFDDRINNPLPLSATPYAATDPRVRQISIDASNAQRCEYRAGSQWNALTRAGPAGQDYYRWSVANPSSESGYYTYPVRCEFDGTLVNGEGGDTIRFGIDAVAPRTNATYQNAAGETVLAPEHVQTQDRVRITLQCKDPVLGELGEGAGCEGIYIREAGQETFERKVSGDRKTTYTLALGETIEYYSKDNAGNTESIREITAVEKNTNIAQLIRFEVTP